MKKNNYKGYNNRNNRYGGNSITASSSDTPSQKIEGEEPSIGVVLGSSFENIEKKAPFEIFREKMCNYN